MPIWHWPARAKCILTKFDPDQRDRQANLVQAGQLPKRFDHFWSISDTKRNFETMLAPGEGMKNGARRFFFETRLNSDGFLRFLKLFL